MKTMKGRIVEIEKYQSRATYIKQGIKGYDQYKYDNYPGGNGTYDFVKISRHIFLKDFAPYAASLRES